MICPFTYDMFIHFVLQNIMDAAEHNSRALDPKLPRRSPSLAASAQCNRDTPPPPHDVQAEAENPKASARPLLIFKKLRSTSSGRPTSGQASIMEEPPTSDSELIAAAAVWPVHFAEAGASEVDSQQLLVRLKAQVMDACTKCHLACYETRRVTKEVARQQARKVEQLDAQDDAELVGYSLSDSQTKFEEPPIEQLEIIGMHRCSPIWFF
jgi:hypothetical protein